jgi:hypothetical protein
VCAGQIHIIYSRLSISVRTSRSSPSERTERATRRFSRTPKQKMSSVSSSMKAQTSVPAGLRANTLCAPQHHTAYARTQPFVPDSIDNRKLCASTFLCARKRISELAELWRWAHESAEVAEVRGVATYRGAIGTARASAHLREHLPGLGCTWRARSQRWHRQRDRMRHCPSISCYWPPRKGHGGTVPRCTDDWPRGIVGIIVGAGRRQLQLRSRCQARDLEWSSAAIQKGDAQGACRHGGCRCTYT